jgi:hypothetical protein
MKHYSRIVIFLITLCLSSLSYAGVGYFDEAYIIFDFGSGNIFRQITSPTNDLLNAGAGFNLTGDGTNAPLSDDLGDFDITSADTLLLNGFEINTYNDSGDSVTNAELFYRVTKSGDTPGSYSSILLSTPNSTSGNDKFWQPTASNIDVLNGLDNGDYTIDFYFRNNATFNSGSGSFTMGNWGPGSGPSTTFTVIPEPSSLLMLGIAGLASGGIALLRRRKRS